MMPIQECEFPQRLGTLGPIENLGLTRSQRGFFLLIGFSVIVLSFAYGISVGLKKPRHWAMARPEAWEAPLDRSAEIALLSALGLPAELELSRLGQNATVNDRPATIVSFTTELSPSRLLRDQKLFWESSGFKVLSTEGKHRGVLVGYDPSSQRKLYFSVWTVPPAVRPAMSQGRPVQGMLSLLEGEKESAGEGSKLVPGVPLIPGGRGGAVFGSDDLKGKTYSSVYTNPGSIRENTDFYRREMESDGWTVSGGGISDEDIAAGHLTFRRDNEEVVLLFSPKGKSGEDEKTVVAVFRGPKLEIQNRVF